MLDPCSPTAHLTHFRCSTQQVICAENSLTRQNISSPDYTEESALDDSEMESDIPSEDKPAHQKLPTGYYAATFPKLREAAMHVGTTCHWLSISMRS